MHTRTNYPNLKYLKSISPNCEGVLWDMDGTIMQTEMLHAQAIHALILEQHPEFELNAQIIQTDCWGETDFIVFAKYQRRKLLDHLNFEEYCQKKEDHIKANLKQAQSEDLISPKIRIHLQEIQKDGISQALVTSSEKSTTHLLLELFDLKDFFNLIITREDTEKNKPHPAPYLHAMKTLRLNADKVVIYEDSAVGLQSAVSSGAVVCHAKWYTNH